MFKAIQVFNLNSAWVVPTLAQVEEKISIQAFQPCGATQKLSQGFEPPRNIPHAPFVESIDGQWILKFHTQKKSVPASLVKEKVKERCEAITAESGRVPGRKEKADIKDEVIQSLLPLAFPRDATMTVWIDRANHRLVVGAGSLAATDGLITLLLECLSTPGDNFGVTPVDTEASPTAMMSKWLTDREAPQGFSFNRSLELVAADESKARVKYTHHPVDVEEISKHIEQGKLPSWIAMTFDDKVSFVLDNNLTIKKLELVEDEATIDMSESVDAFEGTVTLWTRSLQELLPALYDAMQ